jgi:predicted nucleic acid-binding protein
VIGADLVVCYLAGQPPDLADRAAEVIDSEELLALPPVAVAEAAEILVGCHGVSRQAAASSLIELLQKENISALGVDRDHVLEALLMSRDADLSFHEAMVWASAKSAGLACYVLEQ